jgi:hypothetical protein
MQYFRKPMMAVLGKFYEDKKCTAVKDFPLQENNTQFFVVHVYLFLHMELRDFVV